MPPKKHAVTQGILASRGEILCFTDADCLPSRQWVESMVSYFDTNVGIVAGYSLYDPQLTPLEVRHAGFLGLLQKILHSFVVYEGRKVAALAGGSAGLGIPWLCKASNLAYRRKVWDDVGGFSAISDVLSGDDDLFLQRVVHLTSWDVVQASAPEATVHTLPPPTISAFVAQRRRHFSVGMRYPIGIQLLIALYHASNAVFVISLVTLLLSGIALPAAVAAAAGRLIADSLLLLMATPPPRQARFLPGVLFLEGLYLMYILLIGPLGLFGKVEWKN